MTAGWLKSTGPVREAPVPAGIRQVEQPLRSTEVVSVAEYAPQPFALQARTR
jgi:hypothetical protein